MCCITLPYSLSISSRYVYIESFLNSVFQIEDSSTVNSLRDLFYPFSNTIILFLQNFVTVDQKNINKLFKDYETNFF